MSFGPTEGAAAGALLAGIAASVATGGIGTPVIMAAMAGAGTGMQAGGQYQQARTQAQIMDYNAKVADQNAAAAKQQADYETDKMKSRQEKLLGRQRALYAKSGVRFEGSPLLVMKETAGEGEQDVQEKKREAALESALKRSKAGLLHFKADAERDAGILNTGRTLLTGIEKTADRYGRKGRRIYIGRR